VHGSLPVLQPAHAPAAQLPASPLLSTTEFAEMPAEAIPANSPESDDSRIIEKLMEVISRTRPMAQAQALLAEDVALYMDDRKIGNNRKSWFRWVQFIHHRADRRGLLNLRTCIEKTTLEDGLLTVTASWRADIEGRETRSAPGRVAYRLRDGRIIEIRTHRDNYTFIHGPGIGRPLGFLWLPVRLSLWRSRPSSSESQGPD